MNENHTIFANLVRNIFRVNTNDYLSVSIGIVKYKKE